MHSFHLKFAFAAFLCALLQANAVADTATAGRAADSVTHHSIVLGGKPYAYTARAGTITLRAANEKPTADIFYVAYTVDGPAVRPITFVFNGGPGSSTMWLHMGSFGPSRVAIGDGITPAPYSIVSNDESILDATDLVFIDAPETGFSRIGGVGKQSDFFGVDKDVAAFEQFIQRYLTTFNRWNSPKFVYGESYGTTRGSALVDALAQNENISINGLVLQSTILNFGIDTAPVGGSDWPYVLYLPTETATAWYHHAIDSSMPLENVVAEAERFAMGEYADALAKGATLGTSEYEDVVRQLRRFTGASEADIRTNNLRLPYSRFENRLFLDQGRIIGRIDSRFETKTPDRIADAQPWDPTDAVIDAPFTAAVNQYLSRDLGYQSDTLYRANAYAIIGGYADGWDVRHRGVANTNVEPDLSEAMSYNPHLKVFSASGYYDFATPFFEAQYSLNHLAIDDSLRGNISYGFYPSGHMIYIDDGSRKKLHDDLENWYARTLEAR